MIFTFQFYHEPVIMAKLYQMFGPVTWPWVDPCKCHFLRIILTSMCCCCVPPTECHRRLHNQHILFFSPLKKIIPLCMLLNSSSISYVFFSPTENTIMTSHNDVDAKGQLTEHFQRVNFAIRQYTWDIYYNFKRRYFTLIQQRSYSETKPRI